MPNGAKIAKVTLVWGTIVYLVCVLIAWILPLVYVWGAKNMVHFGMTVSAPSLTLAGVIQGLIIWDLVAVAMVWLFVWLYNKMK
ncbi:MAG: hypothetical protein CEN88_29 [Candidatus Berkelbacteria bacterium Licking1014_2]|uniref:Uncharacterized protein n=1 Tax=Candidatus Berkelbacteria bacterium Licking1014_2 TaxID=2017146 RepID=A0A554LX72_9BACT|nr:MAG: hypothetical protein CEN88_29 [Candidatus Berkelbacteria bacterium Licking1014_2]